LQGPDRFSPMKKKTGMKIGRIGIVGCGVMGSGIAQLCAQRGHSVIVSEASEATLAKGMERIRSALSRLVEKGKLSQSDKSETLGRIVSTSRWEGFDACDLVIEAVTEDLELKKHIFEMLDRICPEKTILATNTSVLSVIEIAKVTSRPHQVLGTHFLTPPDIIPLLELVRTLKTDPEIVRRMAAFGEHIGKKVVVSNDRPGFIVNRILTAILLNAVRLLDEGVAGKEDIEAAVKTGLGLPMGPFELMDLIGLDTLALGTDAMFRELNDPQYACPVRIRRMVSAGWLGRKSGKGFYEYDV